MTVTTTATTDAASDIDRLRESGRVADHLANALAAAGQAMNALLDGTSAAGWQGPDPDTSPSTAEDVGALAAATLDRTARRALELHRVDDGPSIAEFARACLAYSTALRVAAAGRWPADLDGIHAAMRHALRAIEVDTRLTARGALRGHELDMADLRASGPAGVTFAARIDHETRHALAELQRIAAAPAATTPGGLF